MAFAQQVASAKVDVRSRDMAAILGPLIFALLTGPGFEAADFADMVAFPHTTGSN